MPGAPYRCDIMFTNISYIDFFSRAIAQYLVTKYGAQQNQQSLYPTDPQQRATIDQHLYISEIAMDQIVSYVVCICSCDTYPGINT